MGYSWFIRQRGRNNARQFSRKRPAALLCCLPRLETPNLNYNNVFRVLIVQFMDAHNLDLRALKKSCVHFALPDGKLIPFEAYNVFYRGHLAKRSRRIQAEIAEATARRKKIS